MKTLGTFYALELGFGISRFYKIYVTESALCGAKIADKDFSAMQSRATSPAMAIHGLGGLAGGAIMNQVAKAGMRSMVEKEEKADALEPGSQTFLQLDKNNFSLGPSQLAGPRLSYRLGIFQKGQTRYGTLQFTSGEGKRRQFYLVGENRKDEITALIRRLLPGVEVVA